MSFVSPVARNHHGIAGLVRHLGGLGIFFLAIVDSSPIPTFGGLDILLAVLAARQREPWYYYAAVATAGSVIGAYLTVRIARKAGLDYINHKFGQKKIGKLLDYFKRWGTGFLALSTLVPFPFPTSAFFAIAGVLDYPLSTFVIVVALGRAVRYAAFAAIASHYGHHFVHALRRLGHHSLFLVAIAAAVVSLIVAAIWLRKRLQANRPMVATDAT